MLCVRGHVRNYDRYARWCDGVVMCVWGVYLAAVVLRDDGRGGLQQQAHAGQVAVHGGVVQRGVAGAVGLLEQRVALEVQHQAQAVAVPRGGAQV